MLELRLPIITAHPLNRPDSSSIKASLRGSALDRRLLRMEMRSSYFIYLNPMVLCSLHIHEELNASLSTLEGGAV